MSAPTWHPQSPAERDRMVALLEHLRNEPGINAAEVALLALTFDPKPAVVARTVRGGKGGLITYNASRLHWQCVNTRTANTYACAVDCVCDCWPPDADRDAAHALLMDLKANPTEVAPYRASENCIGYSVYVADSLKNFRVWDGQTLTEKLADCRDLAQDEVCGTIHELLRGPQVPQ